VNPASLDFGQFAEFFSKNRVLADTGHFELSACFRKILGRNWPKSRPPPYGVTPGRSQLWVRLGEDDVRRMAGAADTRGMERVRDVASRCGSSVDAVWERVRRGELNAYRAPRGAGQWGWWISPQPPQLAPTDAHWHRQVERGLAGGAVSGRRPE
jgi:hypothetical protein